MDVVVAVDDVTRRNVPPVRPPVVMSYSQMFQWPVQAGAPPICTALSAGQRIENRIFLPSHDTSGVAASPLPSVNCAVMLCSGALGEDFSRIIRSPPGAVGAPLVGFRPIVLTRLAYAMGTSPCTVTVLESDLEPPPQARERQHADGSQCAGASEQGARRERDRQLHDGSLSL